jgi:hypothetical protein
MNSRSKIAMLGTTALATFGLGTAVAQAEPVKVIGGETELKLNKKTGAALEDLGLTVKGTSYDVKKGEYDFAPISDGGGGILKHKGTLTISGDDDTVKLKSFTVDVFGDEGTQPDPKIQGVLIAKVGGKSVEIANLSTKNYESDEEDFTFTNLVAKLSEDGAKALNKAFGVKDLEAGLKLGKLSNESEVK